MKIRNSLKSLRGSPLLAHRLTRTLPHVVDTLLLGSAIAMAVMSGQYPFAQPWLTAKLMGLLAYIGFGTVALKRGRTPAIRARFFVLALLAYAYIAGDQPLADWLIQQGLNPNAQYPCVYGWVEPRTRWTVSAKELRALKASQ